MAKCKERKILQMTYKLYDEENNLLNECGEIEAAAFEYFMEE